MTRFSVDPKSYELAEHKGMPSTMAGCSAGSRTRSKPPAMSVGLRNSAYPRMLTDAEFWGWVGRGSTREKPMNALLHEVDSIEYRAVESTGMLCDALDEMLGRCEDLPLINTYIVTVYEETLSDGSKTRSVGIRVAERV